MRWVLDTNVVASALLWGGKPLKLLQARRDLRIGLVTSTPLLAELTDIFSRSKFEKKILAAQLSIDQLVDRYAELTILVRPYSVHGIAPDADDDVVIGTALAGRADTIVTGDHGLLGVGQYQGVRIVDTATAWQLIEPIR